MSSLEFHSIPTDIIEAWAKGEYYVGDIPSISYNRLGIALSLRGWYTYESVSGLPHQLAGVAKIDIKGPFLFLGGIRLVNKERRTTVFWQTEASYFASDDEIIWFYSVFNHNFDDNHAEIRDKYLDTEWLQQNEIPLPGERFGMEPKAWNNLLDKLRTDFDSDIERIKQSCQKEQIEHGMLRYHIFPDKIKDEPNCEYYQFYSEGEGQPGPIQGKSRFNKISKVEGAK